MEPTALGGVPVYVIQLCAFVATMAFSVGLLRAKFGSLIETLSSLSVGLSKQTDVMREVTIQQVEITRLLADLNMKHTPERAGSAGFGTVELRDELHGFRHEFELHTLVEAADIREQRKDHAEILKTMNQVAHKIETLLANSQKAISRLEAMGG